MLDSIDIAILTDIAERCETASLSCGDIAEKVKISIAAKQLREAICLITGEGL